MNLLIKSILLLSIFLSLCGANEKVSIQLQWLHQFQFAGFYIAKERGLYTEAGLDVTIKEFDFNINVVDDVITQKSEYGVGRSSLLIDRSNGHSVIALGAVFQHSPSVLISTNKEIKTLKDLKNKRVMITSGEASSVTITSMLLSESLFIEDIEIQPHSSNLDDLIQGKTDVMACYLSNEPYTLDKAKIPYRIFSPKDYGFDFYEDIIFTSDKQLQTYPERTKRFYEASIKGWEWAFENIEETAQIIFNKYNSQNKSLDSLVYEGQVLKQLALGKNKKIGFISTNQMKKIADIYKLAGFLKVPLDFATFIDPLGFNKTQLKIGVLANRGNDKTLKRWEPLATYLNGVLENYHISIVPIHFNNLQKSLKREEVDFLLANTMNYVQLENKYGISRIVTLKSRGVEIEHHVHNYFGGVIFTKRDSHIDSINAIKGSTFAAVNENSFGGWVMAYELLHDNGLDRDDIELTFYNTHDDVVYAVLNGKADVGTVRSDTLENMLGEKHLDLKKLRILNPQKNRNFPHILSTKLYPEWPLSKLQHVEDTIASEVMIALVKMQKDSKEAIKANIGGWTVPLDYSSVHRVLKKLKLAPYDNLEFSVFDIFKKYAFWIYALLLVLTVGFLQYIHIKKINRDLDKKVNERTHSLSKANEKLKELAHKDALTGIYSRGHFIVLAKQFFSIAKRNHSQLQVLSLDIDHFKLVNDNYGHHVGDEILKLFCNTITSLIRDSNIFGRIGGEEFVICLQNTNREGAIVFSEKILKEIRNLSYIDNVGNIVKFTVSIGLAELVEHKNFTMLLDESDKALYRAKNSGRDKVNY